jgi:hypothetical protein
VQSLIENQPCAHNASAKCKRKPLNAHHVNQQLRTHNATTQLHGRGSKHNAAVHSTQKRTMAQ